MSMRAYRIGLREASSAQRVASNQARSPVASSARSTRGPPCPWRPRAGGQAVQVGEHLGHALIQRGSCSRARKCGGSVRDAALSVSSRAGATWLNVSASPRPMTKRASYPGTVIPTSRHRLEAFRDHTRRVHERAVPIEDDES